MANNDFPTDKLVGYDLEVYPNYFLCGFISPDGIVTQYTDKVSILRAIQDIHGSGYTLAGFNSNRYDDPVLSGFLEKGDPHQAYELSCGIISGETQPWSLKFTVADIKSVDLMPLLPGQMSLKQVGVRMYHDKLQELPIHPHKHLSLDEKEVIRLYNINDLDITRKLIGEVQGALDMRRDLSQDYGVDLRSKGDAGIAEIILSKEVGKLNGKTPSTMKSEARSIILPGAFVTVKPPTWWNELRNHMLPGSWLERIHTSQGARFNKKIPLDHNGRMVKGSLSGLTYLDDSYYRTGVGGIHSVDGSGCYVVTDDEFLIDIDVTSYYPAIALTQKLFPRHTAEHYGNIYEKLVNTRLEAKRSGDNVVAGILKITINGAFGKSSDPYSSLYDPSVTAGITVTGQVALLVLIAMLADNDISVVSANTDGITAKGNLYQLTQLHDTVKLWEKITRFDMEYTEYKATYQLDVNNYLAVKTDGSIKAKGRFTTPAPGKHDLRHSVNFNIVAQAVKDYIQHGVELHETIRDCTDINLFAITQAVKGDWKTEWQGQELGKLVRFYKSTASYSDPIIRIPGPDVKGNQGIVANSENCVPIQDLPNHFPQDIDYEWYIAKAEEWIAELTQPKRAGQNVVANQLAEQGLTPAMVSSDPEARSSRAFTEPGSVDWNSLPDGMEMGISTGARAGVIAVVDEPSDRVMSLFKFDGKLPSKTRKKVEKDNDFNIIYGTNVLLGGKWDPTRGVPVMSGEQLEIWKKHFYTPAELKKCGAIEE